MLNPYPDQLAIYNRIDTLFPAYTVVEDVPDATQIVYVNGEITAYITVDFSMPTSLGTGRSISVEEKQPTEQSVVVSVVAGSNRRARQICGSIVEQMTGFVPSVNCGPLRLFGGGNFTFAVENKPTAYIAECYFRYPGNMSLA